MSKIKITTGSWNEASTSEKHIVSNHLLDPNKNIDKVIQYAEKRHLMTFLVSGVQEGRYTAPGFIGKDSAKTKVKQIPEKELISDNAWKYKIMGRIQKPSVIISTSAEGTPTAGSSTEGGTFSLKLQDNRLKPGMNVWFNNGKCARITTMPTGTQGNFLYNFKCFPGDTFSYSTWIGSQVGTKTCWGGHSSYGERSLRGYGTVYYPDEYINHMTIQRKGLNISGDAHSQEVRWYEYKGSKGFVYESEAQNRAQFILEDEWQKWWGKSNMKDSNGNLLNAPAMTDQETGEPLVQGDGVIEQIKGANDLEASGTDGLPVYEDYSDLLTNIRKKSNAYSGMRYYGVTGTEGMDNAQIVIAERAKNVYHMTQNIQQSDEAGGASPAVGFKFNKLNVGGNQIIFVENIRQSDEDAWSRTLGNGKSFMGNTTYIIDQSDLEGGKQNMEIRARGRAGINRNFVYFVEKGMTGEANPQSSIDARRIEMLKQNLVVVYNTKSCGILEPSSTV